MSLVDQYQKEIDKNKRDPIDLSQANIIDRDRASWEQRLREEADKSGATYDPSDLEGVIRNFSYAGNAGRDPEEFIRNQVGVYKQRAGPSGGGGGDANQGGSLSTNLGRTVPGTDPHNTLKGDLSNPADSINERGEQTNITTGYRNVLPATRQAGEDERNSIYGAIINQMRNPQTESNEKLRSLYGGIPEFTKNLVGDWRNDDFGLLGDVRSRYATHSEGVGDDIKNRISERGAGAIRGVHDDVSRERDARFARNPYAVDSNLDPGSQAKLGQQFADNSRESTLAGEGLDLRAKEFGLSGIKDIDFNRFGAAERGDERYRGTGAATEFGIQDRDSARSDTGVNQMLNLFGSGHGPSAMEAGYDLSRRGIDDNVVSRNQGIANKDYMFDKGTGFQSEQAALDRALARRGQDKGVDSAKESRAPWWSYLLPF